MSTLRTSSFNPKYSDFIVRADGRGTHLTIGAAIAAASELDGPQTVLIGPGVYTEDLVLEYNVSLLSLSTPTTTINFENEGSDLVPDTAETIIKGNHIVSYHINPHIITLTNIRFESNDVDAPIFFLHNLDSAPTEEVYGSVFKFKNCTLSQFEVGGPTDYEVVSCPATTMFGGLQCEFEESTIFMATPSMFILKSGIGEARHGNSFTFKNCMLLNGVEGSLSSFYITDASLTLIDCKLYTSTTFNIDSTNVECTIRIEDSYIAGNGEIFKDDSEGAGVTYINAISSYFINRDVGGIDTPIFAAANKEMYVRLTDCTIENTPSYLTGGLAILEIANTLNTNATYTGNISFEGIRILGSGTGSGDGLERGTIELVPEVDLYSISGSGYGDGGQYLVIDPTAPGHIHIRAGGDIDEAAAQLILGGEKANVTVRDQNDSYVEKHYVTINTHDNSTNEYAWTFDNNGNLVLPAGGDIVDSTGTTVIGSGAVKLTAPVDRRIEEVHGYNSVLVTEIVTTNLTTVTSRTETGDFIYIDSTTTTIDEVTSDPLNYGFEFSLDNTTWYAWSGLVEDGDERGYGISQSVTYLEGDTVYFRYETGGNPVVWWDKAELPGGDVNFRGAVIDYHAWTGESTIIGTIHIVDDSGEEHITHTEVQSGSSYGENDDLWLVENEGTISYRRIDGESKTLKIQWTAKVFYGSELYD